MNFKFYIPKSSRDFFRRKERVLRIWQVKDKNSIEQDGKNLRRNLAGALKRVKRKNLRVFGDVTFWLVRGSAVRNLIDDDFAQGGHGYRYLYIPLDEIWIDDCNDKDDWPTLWHEYTERRLMARGMNYSRAHDTASQIENTLRRKEEFILPVSHFEQQKPYSCGATALRIVLDFWGMDATENELLNLLRTTPKKGADPKDLVAVARKFGFRVIWKENWTSRRIKQTLKKGYPVIANFQQSEKLGQGHYAVIIGFTRDDCFVLSDPAKKKGFWKTKIKDFMAHWHEFEDKTEKEGIVVYK